MRGKRKRAIGLSIGTRSLALAEINIGAEGEIEVGGLGFVDLPDGAVVRGRIVDPATVSRTIRELFAASQVDGAKEVSLAIADEGSITGLQVLPSMSRNETLEALMGEVENYAALAGGEPALGFRVTNEAVEGTEQRMEVLFLAAPQELVDLYKATMESANLDMSAMETISLAAIRAFTYFTEQDEKTSPTGNEPVMIVTIEKSGGMIIVILNGVIKFIHNIEMGSDKLQSERDFRELARELSTSANYYQNAFPTGGDIENIILSADEPNLADIGEKVGAFLDLSITIPQMPGTAEESKAEEQAGHNLSAYAAIGAAMRATTRDAAAINLLASSKKSGLMSLRKRVTLLLLIVFSVGLLSVGARYYIKSKADAVEQKLISLRAFQEMSETQAIADIVILQNGIAVLKTQTEITDAAVNSIKWENCARILEEIRKIIPKKVWLTSLRWSGPSNVTLSGYAVSYDPRRSDRETENTKAYESAYRFRRTLIDSQHFNPVKTIYVRSTEISDRPVVQFEFRCGVKEEKLGEGEQDETS